MTRHRGPVRAVVGETSQRGTLSLDDAAAAAKGRGRRVGVVVVDDDSHPRGWGQVFCRPYTTGPQRPHRGRRRNGPRGPGALPLGDLVRARLSKSGKGGHLGRVMDAKGLIGTIIHGEYKKAPAPNSTCLPTNLPGQPPGQVMPPKTERKEKQSTCPPPILLQSPTWSLGDLFLFLF